VGGPQGLAQIGGRAAVSVGEWVLLGVVAWLIVGLGVALVLGQVFRRRDTQRPTRRPAVPAAAERRRKRSA